MNDGMNIARVSINRSNRLPPRDNADGVLGHPNLDETKKTGIFPKSESLRTGRARTSTFFPTSVVDTYRLKGQPAPAYFGVGGMLGSWSSCTLPVPLLLLFVLVCQNECGGIDFLAKNAPLHPASYYHADATAAATLAAELTSRGPRANTLLHIAPLQRKRRAPSQPPLRGPQLQPLQPLQPLLSLQPLKEHAHRPRLAAMPQLEIWTPRCDIIRRSYRYSPECGHTRLPQIAARAQKPPAACLITGTGRAGTKFASHLLHLLGWQINHDSRWDFCPCPGKDGSVSHMYAFRATKGCPMPTGFSPGLEHMFLRVGLDIRGPLEYINSRAKDTWKKSKLKKALPGFQDCNMKVPPLETTPMAVQALHKWVLQNTFVGAYSDFVFDVDHFNDNSHRAVENICKHCALHGRLRTQRNLSNPSLFAEMGRKASMAWMEANQQNPSENLVGAPHRSGCPTEEETAAIIDKLPSKENRNHTIHSTFVWNDLARLDKDMTTMAIIVANTHGMQIRHIEPDVEGFVVRCGFSNHNAVTGHWTCFLDRDSKGPPPAKDQG